MPNSDSIWGVYRCGYQGKQDTLVVVLERDFSLPLEYGIQVRPVRYTGKDPIVIPATRIPAQAACYELDTADLIKQQEAIAKTGKVASLFDGLPAGELENQAAWLLETAWSAVDSGQVQISDFSLSPYAGGVNRGPDYRVSPKRLAQRVVSSSDNKPDAWTGLYIAMHSGLRADMPGALPPAPNAAFADRVSEITKQRGFVLSL